MSAQDRMGCHSLCHSGGMLHAELLPNVSTGQALYDVPRCACEQSWRSGLDPPPSLKLLLFGHIGDCPEAVKVFLYKESRWCIDVFLVEKVPEVSDVILAGGPWIRLPAAVTETWWPRVPQGDAWNVVYAGDADMAHGAPPNERCAALGTEAEIAYGGRCQLVVLRVPLATYHCGSRALARAPAGGLAWAPEGRIRGWRLLTVHDT